MNLKDCVLALNLRQGNSNAVIDRTHYHNNGTIYGAKRSWNVGMVFDGINDYIEIDHCSELSFTQNIPFSIELWLQSTETGGGNYLISKHSATKINYEVALQNNKILFQRWDNVSNPNVTSTSSVNDGLWHYIACIYKSDKLHVYIDGLTDATPVSDTTVDATNNIAILIGKYSTGYYTGMIDGVRIYNKGLTANEVKKRYYESKLERFNVLKNKGN